MPKFTSPAARADYLRKVAATCEWRREVIADLAWYVIPKYQKDYTTWANLAADVVIYYENNKDDVQRGDPMFLDHKDSFINVATVINWKSDIRDRLAEQGHGIALARDNGRIVGIYGTHRKSAIEDTYAFCRKIIEASADSQNDQVDNLNDKLQLQLPGVHVTLQLPMPKQEE